MYFQSFTAQATSHEISTYKVCDAFRGYLLKISMEMHVSLVQSRSYGPNYRHCNNKLIKMYCMHNLAAETDEALVIKKNTT